MFFEALSTTHFQVMKTEQVPEKERGKTKTKQKNQTCFGSAICFNGRESSVRAYTFFVSTT